MQAALRGGPVGCATPRGGTTIVEYSGWGGRPRLVSQPGLELVKFEDETLDSDEDEVEGGRFREVLRDSRTACPALRRRDHPDARGQRCARNDRRPVRCSSDRIGTGPNRNPSVQSVTATRIVRVDSEREPVRCIFCGLVHRGQLQAESRDTPRAAQMPQCAALFQNARCKMRGSCWMSDRWSHTPTVA